MCRGFGCEPQRTLLHGNEPHQLLWALRLPVHLPKCGTGPGRREQPALQQRQNSSPGPGTPKRPATSAQSLEGLSPWEEPGAVPRQACTPVFTQHHGKLEPICLQTCLMHRLERTGTSARSKLLLQSAGSQSLALAGVS
ncbi:hypothetical protein AAY473_012571 [Plecturocebus cupreus]